MSNPYKSVMYPFQITAANVNLVDTSPQVIAAFDDSSAVKVPNRLEIVKEAGTAYTLTTPTYKNRRVERFQTTVDSYTAAYQGGSYLIIEAVDDRGRGRPLFFVPLRGFLDSTSRESRLAFPLINGDTFQTGATKFRLRTSVNVANGTGSLVGRLYIDEYTLGGF